MKKFEIFHQKREPTPLEKYQFFDFLKLMFLKSSMACFLSKTAPSTFFAYFSKKERIKNISTKTKRG